MKQKMISKEELIDSIRELTQRIDKLVDENFGYAPNGNPFNIYLEERYKKLETLKNLDLEAYTRVMDEI